MTSLCDTTIKIPGLLCQRTVEYHEIRCLENLAIVLFLRAKLSRCAPNNSLEEFVQEVTTQTTRNECACVLRVSTSKDRPIYIEQLKRSRFAEETRSQDQNA